MLSTIAQRAVLLFLCLSFCGNTMAQKKSATALRSDTIELMTLLQATLDSDIVSEIGIVEEQKDELTKLRNELIAKINEMASMPDGLDKDIEMHSVNDMASKTKSFVDEILLPQQQQRIKELAFQRGLPKDRLSQISYWILAPRMAEILNLSAKQRKDVESEATELWKESKNKIEELKKEIRQIHQDAQEQLLLNLTKKQKKEYLDLVGVPFSK